MYYNNYYKYKKIMTVRFLIFKFTFILFVLCIWVASYSNFSIKIALFFFPREYLKRKNTKWLPLFKDV